MNRVRDGYRWKLTFLFLRFYVLEQDACCLDQLNVDQSIVYVQDCCKAFENVLFDKVVKEVFVELLRVDCILGDVANDFHDHLLVALGDHERKRAVRVMRLLGTTCTTLKRMLLLFVLIYLCFFVRLHNLSAMQCSSM